MLSGSGVVLSRRVVEMELGTTEKDSRGRMHAAADKRMSDAQSFRWVSSIINCMAL